MRVGSFTEEAHLNTQATTAAQYPRRALINRFEGNVDAETLFRNLADASKVRFAMNVQDILFVTIADPPQVFVMEITPAGALEVGDGIGVMSSAEVSTLLAFLFSDEKRIEELLPKEGQIYLLCYNEPDEYKVVIFWNSMRRAWEIQKFDGEHNTVSVTESGFFLGPSTAEGRSFAVVA